MSELQRDEQPAVATPATASAEPKGPEGVPAPEAPEGLEGVPAPDAPEDAPAPELVRVLEALLFLSPDPVPLAELADAAEVEEEQARAALERLAAEAQGARGIVVREVAGGFTLASDPLAEDAARRLLARPRTPPLSPAQAETLAIVAYLQPVSRPEIARIRGVSADSATATLLERGLIEESGRSRFGAILYRTSELFLRLFGLGSPRDLPDPAQWDPTPEEVGELRERLTRAGDARSGAAAPPAPSAA